MSCTHLLTKKMKRIRTFLTYAIPRKRSPMTPTGDKLVHLLESRAQPYLMILTESYSLSLQLPAPHNDSFRAYFFQECSVSATTRSSKDTCENVVCTTQDDAISTGGTFSTSFIPLSETVVCVHGTFKLTTINENFVSSGILDHLSMSLLTYAVRCQKKVWKEVHRLYNRP